jgi:hypothetical protein
MTTTFTGGKRGFVSFSSRRRAVSDLMYSCEGKEEKMKIKYFKKIYQE